MRFDIKYRFQLKTFQEPVLDFKKNQRLSFPPPKNSIFNRKSPEVVQIHPHKGSEPRTTRKYCPWPLVKTTPASQLLRTWISCKVEPEVAVFRAVELIREELDYVHRAAVLLYVSRKRPTKRKTVKVPNRSKRPNSLHLGRTALS